MEAKGIEDLLSQMGSFKNITDDVMKKVSDAGTMVEGLRKMTEIKAKKETPGKPFISAYLVGNNVVLEFKTEQEQKEYYAGL